MSFLRLEFKKKLNSFPNLFQDARRRLRQR